jgi:hypothetical protein
MPEPRIGPVQPTQDGQGKFAGIGFVVYGNDGRPAATFGFLNDVNARTAAKKVSEIIALCRDVKRCV